MGKTGAVRNKEYRERMDEETKNNEREKNKEQQKKSRAKWSTARKKEEARKAKERMRKYRLKKAALSSIETLEETPTKHYNSPQALGKAVSRVKKNLPLSPRKQIAVITKLSRDMNIVPTKSKALIASSTADWSQIIDFYSSDLISRIMPGKKDYVSVKTEAGKKSFQKRVLVMTVMEAYRTFTMEYPHYKIGKSKFASLRPPFVLPVSEKDHTVCCGRYHENFDLLIQGLRKFCSHLPSHDEIISSAVCNWDPVCCLGDCKNCTNIEDYVESLFMDIKGNDNNPGEYLQWLNNNKKERVSSDFGDMKKELQIQLKSMIKHSFTAKVQLRQIKHLKGILKGEEAVLHVDFAENFAIKHQNEIMSAHWVSQGVTLYTAVVNDKDKAISYVVVSGDDLCHDKCAVFIYNKAIISAYSKDKSLSTLHIFSDGAGSQFKNRYSLSTLLEPEKIHPGLTTVDWSFFGTAHGKGPVDGVGGTVKRAVWRRVLQENAVVNTAKEFADVAAEACPNINIIYIPMSQTSIERECMLKEWDIRKPNAIPKLHTIHYVTPKSDNFLTISKLSPFLEDIKVDTSDFTVYNELAGLETEKQPLPSENNRDFIANKPEPQSQSPMFNKDDFVLVQYDENIYPGIVEEVEDDNYLVDVMHSCRGGWTWPMPRDQIWYSKEKVLKKIDHPEPVNDRGVFKFCTPLSDLLRQ